MTVNLLSIDKLHADVNLFSIIVFRRKKTLEFSEQASCYGPHPLVCLLHLGGTVLLASESLDQLQVFDFSSVALSDFQFFLSCYIATELDDLVQEFGVGWKGHILLLYRRVYEGCLIGIGLSATVVLVILLVFVLFSLVINLQVDANAFLENQLNTRFSYAMAEAYEFGRYAGNVGSEGFHAAEVLIVGILGKLSDDCLIRHIAQMLQDKKSYHQTDRFCCSSIVMAI